MSAEKKLTGYPSIDKPWLKYYSEEAINAPLPECTIYEYIWNSNKDHLNNIALNYFDRKITYKELFESIEKTAKAFTAMGVKEGDIVVTATVTTPETVYILYALNRIGAIPNMVDPRTGVDGIREYIKEVNAEYVITLEVAYPKIAKAIEGTSVKKILVTSPADSLPAVKKFFYKMANHSEKLSDICVRWEDFIRYGKNTDVKYASYKKDSCCVIAHTGGTTGLPKGVMLSNDNLNAVAHGYQYLGIPFERKHRYFNDLPPFIMYGLCLATHTTLSYGLEVILYPIFDSKSFPKQFAKHKPHHFSALVDHLKYLTIDKRTQKLDMSFLISPGVGGDAVECDLEKKVNKFLAEHNCKYEVCKGYGMTELSATAVITFKGANEIGSVGIPLITNNIKVVNTETNQELGYDEIGEIWISSPSLMLGYYNNPKETNEIIIIDKDGYRWIRTGDLGRITKDGLLFHEGRMRRIYMTVHEGQPAKIFPSLVESAIKKSQYVYECSVVGRKRNNSDYYEAVAFVVKNNEILDSDVIIDNIFNQCREGIPTYMLPSNYYFIETLPHTPVGKLDFRALEKMAEEQMKGN